MELNEAARRIVGQHWRWILTALMAGVLVSALLHLGSARSYTAATRLVLDTPDPKAFVESTAIADTGRAIATSPAQVTAAIADAHVTGRDAIVVAQKHVFVSSLGTSGVLQLSVSDKNPDVAAAIANALAARVIKTRLSSSNGRTDIAVGNLERRIALLSKRIAQSDVATRAVLLQQRGALQSEEVALIASNALRPEPLVISQATPPQHPDSAHAFTYLGLGAVLGLLVGVGLAGLLETLWPTLVGGDALSREFGTPYLGALPGETNRVGIGVRLAAEAAGVRNLRLIAVGQDVDLESLARQLDATRTELEVDRFELSDAELAEPARRVAVVGGAPVDGEASAEATGQATGRARSGRTTKPLSDSGGVRIRPFGFGRSLLSDVGGAGLIVVTPKAVRKSALDDTRQLLRVTRLPVLGLLISEPASHSLRKRRSSNGQPAEPEAGTEL